MIGDDNVRLPSPLDPLAGAYKDWLHLNLFDDEADIAGLVNVSIHGAPGAPATQVVGAALFDVGGVDWIGNVTPGSWIDASITTRGVATATAAVTIADDGGILAAAQVAGVAAQLTARRRSPAHTAELPQRFGSGWISWRVLPQLAVAGSVVVDDRTLAEAAAYHDHNWGRWHWGDDIGWEWGCFLGRGGDGVVIARTTDRAHRAGGPLVVLVDHDGVRRVFTGARARATWRGPSLAPTRRLPGALAALHEDRRRPDVPANLELQARCGSDTVELAFSGRAMAQLILADPAVVGYSFLHETSGRFVAHGLLGGRQFDLTGLGIVEWLE